MTASFFEPRASLEEAPILALTVCAGFESGRWREKRLVEYLFDWLPRFALKAKEREYLRDAPYSQLKKALYQIYEVSRVERTEKRGEIGELLLHILCVEFFQTAPIILTVFYKSASNDTVKGWDCVHYRRLSAGKVELWFGEAKFYEDAKKAISRALKSIKEHMEDGFLQSQKIIVGSKIEDDFEDYAEVKALFDLNTSLDNIVGSLVVPVLVTYDSAAVASATLVNDEYIDALQTELRELFADLLRKAQGLEVVMRVIFVPLSSKENLIRAFDAKMDAIQR